MKKVYTFIIAAILAVSCTACTNNSNTSAETLPMNETPMDDASLTPNTANPKENDLEIPEEALLLVETYINALRIGVHDAVKYVHFSDDITKDFYLESNDYLLDYRIESSELINNDLVAFTIHSRTMVTDETGQTRGEGTYMMVYNFVARIDGDWYYITGVRHIPEDLKDNFDESKYKYDDPNIVNYEDVLLPNQILSPVSVERIGFEGGNIGAGGLVCGGDDGFIYFRSENDWRLYRAKPDGSERTKVCDCVGENINILDGWVYFINHFDDNAVYRVRTDGTAETKLVEGYCGDLYVADSGMYFDIRNEYNVAQVYHADLDGGKLTKLIADCYVAYYYNGKIYTKSATAYNLGVYDIAADEQIILVQTYVHNVSVDESGVYYWAVDKGEFHCLDLDGGNDRIILRGGDFFNYTSGSLYYMGISENANGPCHVTNRLNLETGEIVTLYEELNEFFDSHGNLIGVTYKQLENEGYDPDIFEYVKGERVGEYVLKSGGIFFNEYTNYIYVIGEHIFMCAGLRESLIQKGSMDCLVRLDGGLIIWN